MCWTISSPRRAATGSAGSSSPSARGPPVEEAITTSGGAARGRRGARRGLRRAAGGAAAVAGRRTRPLWAAASTLRPSSCGEGAHALADRRLGDQVERALGERVDGAGAVGGGEGGDDDDRHRVARPSRSARSTPMPSRPGIARSSVIASGRWSRQAASASSPSAAVADDVEALRGRGRRPASAASARESSATTTRCLAVREHRSRPAVRRVA